MTTVRLYLGCKVRTILCLVSIQLPQCHVRVRRNTMWVSSTRAQTEELRTSNLRILSAMKLAHLATPSHRAHLLHWVGHVDGTALVPACGAPQPYSHSRHVDTDKKPKGLKWVPMGLCVRTICTCTASLCPVSFMPPITIPECNEVESSQYDVLHLRRL